MRDVQSLTDLKLMQRLAGSREPNVRALTTIVDKVARNAAHLLATVVRDMPLYTLHNERHILNVIQWMEELLGSDGLRDLSNFECAMCILAAYTHDLGMTLSEAERGELFETPEYVHFSDGYPEERARIESLRNADEPYRADLLEIHLRAEYLRQTHASDERIGARLLKVAPELFYEGFDFRRQLELVIMSHKPVSIEECKFAADSRGRV